MTTLELANISAADTLSQLSCASVRQQHI